jgi:hypothetical protein
MTREFAINLAIAQHKDRCKAWHKYWMNGGQEPRDENWGFHHGWFQIADYSIGAHEYAPGPTYNVD